MRKTRNVTPGVHSPNDTPVKRLAQGRGGVRRSKKQEKGSGGTEVTASGTHAEFNGQEKVLTAAVSAAAAEAVFLTLEAAQSVEAESVSVSGKNERMTVQTQEDEAEAAGVAGGIQSVGEEVMSDEPKVAKATGKVRGEEESLEEEAGILEFTRECGWMPTPSVRGVQTAVFDVEETSTRREEGQGGKAKTVGDLERMDERPGAGVEESKQSADSTAEHAAPIWRKARFSEEFGEENEESRRVNQRKPLRKWAACYDLKLLLPPTEPANALEALKGVLSEVWSVLKEADKRMVIYPWNNSAESRALPGLKKVEDLPGTLSGIQEYFNRAFPRKQGGTIYVSVFLGHDKPFKEMNTDYGWWFSGHNCGWYLKALQCEKSVVIGWLLYSTIDMDRDLLAAEILRITGVTVGLRFRTISVNSREQLRKEQMVGAIHIEIDDKNYYGDKVRVEDLYRATQEDFPLCIKLRLCPQIQDATDPSSIIKLERLRLRQAAFLANVQTTISTDIGVLDFEDPLMENWTLRELIMSIRDDDGVSVFVSVDRHYLGRGFVFQFTSRSAARAQMMIRGLIPFLKANLDLEHHHQLMKCFTTDAVTRSMALEWDPVKRCVVSAADKRVDDLLDCWELDEEFEFAETDTTKFELDISVLKKAQEQATAADLFGKGTNGVNPHDDDSVSTLVGRHKEGKPAASKKKGKVILQSVRGEKTEATIRKKTTYNDDDDEDDEEDEEMDKAAVAAAITGKIRELKVKLARAMSVPYPSLQSGQAGGQEFYQVGDGNASGGRLK